MSILKKILNALNSKENSSLPPTFCWLYYPEEKLVGGASFPLEDFQQIVASQSKMNGDAVGLLNESFTEKDNLGEIAIRWGEYTNSFYEGENHRAFIPESITLEDTNDNVVYAIVRIKDKCEFVQYAYYITGEEGHKWYDYIGKNTPVTDDSTIERIKNRLSLYRDLQTVFLKQQEDNKHSREQKITNRNAEISQELLLKWNALFELLMIPTRTANKIYKKMIEADDIFEAFISEMIQAKYLMVIDWKEETEEIVYNYNLLSKKLKGEKILLDSYEYMEPTKVFRLLSVKSEFALYQINIDADSYFIGLCPKNNTKEILILYNELFTILKSKVMVNIINS